MSSKIAENTTAKTAARIPGWSRSITTRLTVLYTLSAFGMLVLATVFLYRVLTSDLERANSQFLGDRLHVLRAILQEGPEGPEALEEEVKLGGDYYARILNEGGQILIETPGMSGILPPSLFPAPISATETQGPSVKRSLRDGSSYQLIAAWAEVGRSNEKRKLLQVGLDVSSEEALITSYRRRLSIVLFLGLLFSAGASVVVARKGMRPLIEITKTAGRITATHLNKRIDPALWPKELILLATAFDRMLDRLEESFTRLSQFSADMAHELRTPINNLMGEAQVALSRTRTPDEYREVIESSLEEYARLSRMIDGLLFLARAESAEKQIERVKLDVRKEIEAVLEFHDAMAKEQGVKVTCEGKESLHADPILFRRAISNLLTNALQYTPQGGKVSLSIMKSDDQSVEVSVSDTGCGIAPEHLPRIFDRFYRADRARSQFPQGIGLGLAIVKSIMDLHGGTVTIQSETSKGTTVTLRFPPPA